MAMHVVQEEYIVHPAYQCVTIQEVLHGIPVMMMEEEVDQLVVCARARARELQVDVQVERASRAVVTANTVTPNKGRTKLAMEPAVCKFFLTAEGCKFGDDCRYKHPRTTGKCLRCGADGHSLSSCT